MKKRPSTLTVQDHVLSLSKSKTCPAPKVTRFVARPSLTPSGKHHSVSYIPGQKPREEPPALPRLFVRGHGGSIKLDLAGVGIGFSEAAFAHMVDDDSLLPLHVCKGDIAVVEPAAGRLKNGNLVLLEVDGRPAIRRFQKKRHVYIFSPASPGSGDVVLPAGQAVQGVIIGFLRLFGKLKPVKYCGTDANYSAGFEVSASPRKERTSDVSLDDPRGRVRLARSLADIRKFFASKRSNKNSVLLSEIDRTISYMARPDNR